MSEWLDNQNYEDDENYNCIYYENISQNVLHFLETKDEGFVNTNYLFFSLVGSTSPCPVAVYVKPVSALQSSKLSGACLRVYVCVGAWRMCAGERGWVYKEREE